MVGVVLKLILFYLIGPFLIPEVIYILFSSIPKNFTHTKYRVANLKAYVGPVRVSNMVLKMDISYILDIR